ncbi:SPOR domain-containing protein [Novosphingobium colocasiae]|uniref:SPOR domain-containing protein n=1 Tax=Novosphingobium colocasiae TaxID=1256513 RepID=UPI0035AD8256
MTNSGFGGSHPGQGGQQDGQNGFGQNDFGQNGYGQSLPDQSGNWQPQEFSAPDQSFAGDPAPLNPDNGGNWQDQNAPAPWQDEPPAVSPEPWTAQEEEEPFFEPAVAAAVPFADDTDAGFEEPAQLALGEDDGRLPWLEGDDTDDEPATGMSQGLLLAVLGAVALALIGGAIFWIARDKPDENLVADGGIITAPDGPYKTRPEKPGGEIVAGTGDTSFAVAEGKTRPAQIGGGNAAGADAPAEGGGKPGFSTAQDKAADAAGAAPAKGPGVQVGAYSSREAAEKGWATLQQRYAAVLSGVQHRVVQGQADIGTVYRLQAVPGDMASARALSGKLEAAGLESSIKP